VCVSVLEKKRESKRVEGSSRELGVGVEAKKLRERER
jgi:hypothetical protein